MANQLNVSPGAILTTSTEFTDVGDTARRIVTDVEGKLPPPEDIAGHDEYGEAFAKQFGPALLGANRLLTDVGGGLDKTGADLKFTAAHLP